MNLPCTVFNIHFTAMYSSGLQDPNTLLTPCITAFLSKWQKVPPHHPPSSIGPTKGVVNIGAFYLQLFRSHTQSPYAEGH